MFLMGASFIKWIKLLWENKFRIHIKYWPKVFAITLVTILFSPFVIFEQLIWNKRIKKLKLEKDPIFIIGHWRGGTTYLQELMLHDKRYYYLNMVEATFPHQFLTSYWFTKTIMSPLIPKKRPMDNMKMNAKTPQEHEFALTNYCLLSPLTALFFPRNKEKYLKYCSFDDATEKELRKWKESFRYLINKLTIRGKGKQLLLKNPLDTFRVKLILDLYPNAKFIHIYRDPYKVFFSTVKLYNTNTKLFYLQKPNFEIKEFIFEMYKEMYKKFYNDLESIPKENIIEIKYEEFCQNPIENLEKIYSQLQLGDFNKVKPDIQSYLDTLREYKPDNYKIEPEVEKEIYENWKETIERWKYNRPI
ncbi:MAG: sulfotransferase [Candidatus Heimdallarchaeum aukensis]|uniref:Sulfotransferase n=1 Tax=Candidatus Heimdallarchaeum aukensis TaxID=2876573 RepID=A0A9Y1FLM7_9ARCH|nr:MAG: sulfotransferase [Candidatus Heimdallarchaeum aukensis]